MALRIGSHPVKLVRQKTRSPRKTTKQPTFSGKPYKQLLVPAALATTMFLAGDPQSPSKARAENDTTPPAKVAVTNPPTNFKELQQQMQAMQQQLKAQQERYKQLEKLVQQLQTQTTASFIKQRQAAIEKTKKALFDIAAIKPNMRADSSGWIFKDKSGKIGMITCHHGVHDFYGEDKNFKFKVHLSNGKTYQATLAKGLPNGEKPLSSTFDLALVSLPKDKELREYLEKVALPLPDLIGKTVPNGTPAMAIGNPLGLKDVVTEGIVSITPTDSSAVNTWARHRYGATRRYINVGINPGNSGGPALGYVDGKWQIIGMTNQKISTDNSVLAYLDPTSVIQVFTHDRGFKTIDLNSPNKEVARQYAIHTDRDHGYPRKLAAITNQLLEKALSGTGRSLNQELQSRGVSKKVYVEEMLVPRIREKMDTLRAQNDAKHMEAQRLGQKEIQLPYIPNLDHVNPKKLNESEVNFMQIRIQEAINNPATPKTQGSRPPQVATPPVQGGDENPPVAAPVGKLTQVNAQNFNRLVKQSNIPAIVLAGDPTQTKALADYFRKLAPQYKGKAKFFQISATEAQKAIPGFNPGEPNVIAFRNGSQAGWYVNPAAASYLRDWINEKTQ